MKVVLIDDEQLAIDIFAILLEDFKDVEVVGMYTNPYQAYEEIQNLEVDVAFLDMEMGDVHGLQFAEVLMMKFPKIEVVFVTAHAEYALEAFEVAAIDYLLKPVKPERLKKAMIKLRGKIKMDSHNRSVTAEGEKQLVARLMGSFRLLDVNDEEVKWRTRKVKELFIYLWHHRGRASYRSRILEELWGDLPTEKASVLMHTTVYQLRKKLKELGIENSISLINEAYLLNVSVQSDYLKLKHMLETIELRHSTIAKLIDLYEGDYLEEESYHWAQPAQEKIKRTFLRHLEVYLTSIIDDKEQSHYIEMCLDKMIQLEPLNERYIHILLNHYAEVQKKERMITVFHQFKERWIEDLGLAVPKEIVDTMTKYIQA